jgi:hypothetical protein
MSQRTARTQNIGTRTTQYAGPKAGLGSRWQNRSTRFNRNNRFRAAIVRNRYNDTAMRHRKSEVTQV